MLYYVTRNAHLTVVTLHIVLYKFTTYVECDFVCQTLSFCQTLIGQHRLVLQAKDRYLCSACSARLGQHVGNTSNGNGFISTVSREKDLPP